MAKIKHSLIPSGERHSPYNWIVADDTDKNAITGVVESDLNKILLQIDTGVAYRLSAIDPATWAALADQPNTINSVTQSALDNKLGISGGTVSGDLSVLASSTNPALKVTQTGTGNALLIEDDTSPDATPFAVTTDGEVLVGLQSPLESLPGQIDKLQVYNGGTTNKGVSVYAVSSTATPQIRQCRARAGNTVLNNNDVIGANQWLGYTGTVYANAALLRVSVDGTPTSTVVPGRLELMTSSTGSPTVKMTVKSDGKVGIGVTAPSELLDVGGNVKATNVILKPPSSVTPANNGEMSFELTSNTTLVVKVKGSDGVVRSTTLTLA